MADPFGRPSTFQEVLDYLGTPTQVTVQGQPALPVSGGGAVGAIESPSTIGGGGFAPPGPEGETPGGGGGGPTGGGGGTPESESPLSQDIASDQGGSNWWLDIARWAPTGQKLLTVANRLLAPSAGSQSTGPGVEPPPGSMPTPPTEGPPMVIEPGELPQGIPTPEPPPTTGGPTQPPPFTEETPQGPVTVPTGPGFADTVIPDEIVNMFGGNRQAVEDAFNATRNAVTAEEVAVMADAGQLTHMGVDSSAALTPSVIANVQTGIAVAGLVLAGLSAAGVMPPDASQILGSMLGLAAFAATGLALESGALVLSTFGSYLSLAGGFTAVLAPFIAWGMNALQKSMQPNLKIEGRRYGAESYQQATGLANTFNSLVDFARQHNITDPNALNQLLRFGEASLLPFYTSEFQMPGGGARVTGGPMGPLWQASEMEQAGDPSFWAPHRQAAQNLAALDQMLGSQYGGRPEWYGALWQGLNPYAGPQMDTPEFFARFGEKPATFWLESGEGGAGSTQWSDPTAGIAWENRVREAYPNYNWSAQEYANLARQYPDIVQAMSGGMDPLDYAIAMWSGQRPGSTNPYNTGRIYSTMGPVPNWAPQTWGAR